MSHYFARNLQFFSQNQPSLNAFLESAPSIDVEVHQARNGSKVAHINGIYINNRFVPQRDTKSIASWTPRDIHLHIGLGMGYGLQADPGSKSTHILIYEPFAQILRVVFEHIPIYKRLNGKNIELITMEEQLMDRLEGLLDRSTDINLFVQPFHQKHDPLRTKRILAHIKEYGQLCAFRHQTYRHRIKQILDSTIESLPYSANCQAFSEWKQTLNGRPAVIAASGPSLSKNLHQLVPFRERFALFAISRSIRPLTDIGLTPDFLVHIEFQDFRELVEGVPCLDQTVFLLPHQSHQGFFQVPARRHVSYPTAANPFTEWLMRHYPQWRQDYIDTGGSVAHDALSLAIEMGADPIILIGQDLAINVTPNLSEEQRQDLLPVDGYFGSSVLSPGNYRQFRQWFINKVAALKKKGHAPTFINATEGGADIPGMQRRSLRDVCQTLLTDFGGSNVTIPTTNGSCRTQLPWREPLERILNELAIIQIINRNMLNSLKQKSRTDATDLHAQFKTCTDKLSFFAAYLQEDLRAAEQLGNKGRAEQAWRKVHHASQHAARHLELVIRGALEYNQKPLED